MLGIELVALPAQSHGFPRLLQRLYTQWRHLRAPDLDPKGIHGIRTRELASVAVVKCKQSSDHFHGSGAGDDLHGAGDDHGA